MGLWALFFLLFSVSKATLNPKPETREAPESKKGHEGTARNPGSDPPPPPRKAVQQKRPKQRPDTSEVLKRPKGLPSNSLRPFHSP